MDWEIEREIDWEIDTLERRGALGPSPLFLFWVSVIGHVLAYSFFLSLSFSVMEARLCVGLSDGDGYVYGDERWH